MGVVDGAPMPENERERLRTLLRYAILDTPPEAAFDELTTLAGEICGTPIALISLVDAQRQWFKARVGLGVSETPRALAFCAHAILGDDVMEVPDALSDPRFADNPLVTGDPDIRFYAGAPLVTNDGFKLGTLCVIDRVPRRLTQPQLRALRILGRQVIDQLELRQSAALLARRLLEVEGARRSADAPTEEPMGFDGGVAQRAFLARVTHDLRTPLNAILGFAEHLGEDAAVRDGERREIADNIADAGRYMLRLVNDILDLAHLDSGQVRFAVDAIDVGVLARATFETIRPLAHAGGNRALVVGESRPIRGDGLRIRQVLSNLLSNACKYTKDGEIRLTIADEGDLWVRVDITDTGIGMSDAQRRLLFRPFTQVQDAARQSREGTGLGLHITRALCERMGGAISVESAPGAGTTFTVWLPLEPTPAPRGGAIAIAEGEPRIRAAIQRALGRVAPLVYIDGVAEVLWTLVERRWRAVIVDARAADAGEVDLLRALARLCAECSAPMIIAEGDESDGSDGTDPRERAEGSRIAGVARWRIDEGPAALLGRVDPERRPTKPDPRH